MIGRPRLVCLHHDGVGHRTVVHKREGAKSGSDFTEVEIKGILQPSGSVTFDILLWADCLFVLILPCRPKTIVLGQVAIQFV